MAHGQPITAATPTRVRIQELGTSLRSALIGVLGPVGGASVRPVALSKSLKLDDSLAARLLRSVRASDPLSSLRELPAPQGLRLFLDAAARAGVNESLRRPAEAAVSQFEAILSELPLGRSSLNTAIDGWLPAGRKRAEQSGKQAVFKALSHTLGFTVDTGCFAVAIQPSALGDRCDSMTFVAMDGIRRLREGAPILLFGHTWPHDQPDDGDEPRLMVETLDGERGVTDARKLLLNDVGDSANLPLRMIDRGNHTRVVLESSAPPLNVPVSAAVAYISRNAYRRYRSPDRPTEVYANACKIPLRVFVQDLLIHEDVFPSFVPDMAVRMDNLSHDPSARDEELLELDRLDLDAELVRLGRGLNRVGLNEWGGYEPAITGAFRRAGWDASKFRVYRCVVRHPFPFVSFTTWFDLPPKP